MTMREALAQRVEHEFAEVEYPGDKNIGFEVEHFIGQTVWQKIPKEILGMRESAIIGFSANAYHFFLPAFLCAVLRYPELEYLEHPLIYSLIPFPDTPDRLPLTAFPLFRAGEKSVIVDFLEEHRELFPYSSYALLPDSVAELHHAIEFWKKTL